MNEIFKTKAEAEAAAVARGLTAYTIHYSNVGSVRNPQPSGWIIFLNPNPNADAPPQAFPRGRWS